MPTYSRYIVIAALASSCVFGCRPRASPPTPATAPSQSTAEKDAHATEYLNVAEAVFRHQFDHNASGAQRNVDYFFISLEKNDPPQALLARFENEKPRVLPASLATSSAGEGVKHKQLGGSGLIFRISSSFVTDHLPPRRSTLYTLPEEERPAS